ncbi:MAG: hypothetical protein Q8L02_08075 [Candidatus Nitrotoga sp.]|nr:hypothetical protein [Candidatus Nitrotoga sp.]
METRGVDVIQHFHPISVAFMHAVDADEARHSIRLRCARRWPVYAPIGRILVQ